MTEKKKISSREASQELADFDYWQKLDDKDHAWLEKFKREYYRNQFDKKKPLHKTKKSKRAVYALDDARRRDLWNNADRSAIPVETLPEENDDE